ncbi:hypothetical protein FW774_17200 [Pedobacter sp. BS3]|uniref:hypothetical protein n=1 Tax=Pedobacter sp. BS3 TaxID=2567937 RepID=UPI0011EDB207|nr:hypothetical protein [Pedobacter sp. BS3]TZF81793.1 hypothetical protein FW774_17200 [Pedobacter sp. BS3]
MKLKLTPYQLGAICDFLGHLYYDGFYPKNDGEEMIRQIIAIILQKMIRRIGGKTGNITLKPFEALALYLFLKWDNLTYLPGLWQYEINTANAIIAQIDQWKKDQRHQNSKLVNTRTGLETTRTPITLPGTK